MSAVTHSTFLQIVPPMSWQDLCFSWIVTCLCNNNLLDGCSATISYNWVGLIGYLQVGWGIEHPTVNKLKSKMVQDCQRWCNVRRRRIGWLNLSSLLNAHQSDRWLWTLQTICLQNTGVKSLRHVLLRGWGICNLAKCPQILKKAA